MKPHPLLLDGFLAEDEWRGLLDLGAVGEVAGRAYDTNGRYLDSPLIARMMSFQVRASRCANGSWESPVARQR